MSIIYCYILYRLYIYTDAYVCYLFIMWLFDMILQVIFECINHEGKGGTNLRGKKNLFLLLLFFPILCIRTFFLSFACLKKGSFNSK